MSKSKETPLMKQYNAIKSKYPDTILLFRVGDFYETFGQDAIEVSKVLNIVLTQRNSGIDSSELAGFPHHSINTYLPKLVNAGLRVAICDQLEDPKLTKTIVKRGVTELVTPGVSLNDDILSAKKNNFLAAIAFEKNKYGLAFLDISTGEFFVSEGTADYIEKLLQSFNPKELLIPKNHKSDFLEAFSYKTHFYYIEDWVYRYDNAYAKLTEHFGVNSLKGFGIDNLSLGIVASGSVLHYLSEMQHHRLGHISKISRVSEGDSIWMDRFTIRNLELYPIGSEGASLLNVIDKTLSPMGARLLRHWLALPSKNIDTIQKRHQGVSYFLKAEELLEGVRGHLKHIGDTERLLAKVTTLKISPREVNALKTSLNHINAIKQLLEHCDDEALKSVGTKMHACQEVISLIAHTLDENAPVLLQKGNVIASGASEELDRLRGLSESGKSQLAAIVNREIERTGISSLKIEMNSVFGYYIEVRNTHKDKVPPEWIRKQTLVNAERYITQELKVYETEILGAEEKIAALEYTLFNELLHALANHVETIKTNAELVAYVDCIGGFARLALDFNYTCPEMDTTTDLVIKNGRHPVIERQLPLGVPYVPNSITINRDTQQIMIITGPNMSGKSALLRQVALIVLLAQIGSFVPAEESRIGIVDKIFTRVGANDNISMGESTFMVEMNETAAILNNISERSLVILDEIGRGTSTYDGISIAWAIAEYLHEHPTAPKTLFATHYHEMNDMAKSFGRIKNFHISIKELQNNILFTRTLEEGGSNSSFGIHVAQMAGVPKEVIERAKAILKNLEASQHGSPQNIALEKQKTTQNTVQLSLFEKHNPVLKLLREVDLERITPIEALMKLVEAKHYLDNEQPS